MKKQHGGARKGAGRKAGPMGAGVQVSVRIPEKLLEALRADCDLDEVKLGPAIVARLVRGKLRGRVL